MALTLLPNSLVYLEAVAKHGSIQAASRALLISASAINRQILMMEEAAGIRLFERHASGMTLTQGGEMLVVLARRWRNDGNDVWSELQKMQGVDSGQFRIAVMDSLVNSVVPDFAQRVGRDYPLVQIDVEVMTPADATDAVTRGEVDLALAFNVRPQRGLQILWSEKLPLGCIVAATHPLATETGISLERITEFPLVLQSQALAIRHLIELDHDWLIHESQQPIVTNSLQLLKIMVSRGRHVAVSSELDVTQELRDGTIVFVPIEDATATAQSISLVAGAARILSSVARSIATMLVDDVEARLTHI